MRTPPLLRTTERSTFAECQWRWYHSYVRGLEPGRVPTWSWFGRAVHEALWVRYPPGRKRGSLADVLARFDEALGQETRRIWVDGGETDEEEVHDARLLGRQMLRGYVKHWGRDVHWDVIHGEQPFQIDVPDWRHPDRLLAVYCGTFDLVVWDRVDKVFRIVDHKTRRSFPSNGKWGFYDLNRQGGSYLWVAPEVLKHLGIMKDGDVLDGIVFNCLKKAMPTEKTLDGDGVAHNKPRKEHFIAALRSDGFTGASIGRLKLYELEMAASQRGLTVYGDVSAVQPAPLYHRYTSRRGPEERVRQARHVQVEAQQMALLRAGKIRPTKNTTEDCPRCPMYEMCTADEISPAEGREVGRHAYRYRDPYADHRQDMADKEGVHVH